VKLTTDTKIITEIGVLSPSRIPMSWTMTMKKKAKETIPFRYFPFVDPSGTGSPSYPNLATITMMKPIN